MLSERTAASRATAALAELGAANDEIQRLRQCLAEAELRVERALAESRRFAAETARALRAEAAAVAKAERMSTEWDAMADRTAHGREPGAVVSPPRRGGGLRAIVRRLGRA